MAVAIKTDEERARLDEIFAQVERELHPEIVSQEPQEQPRNPQVVTDRMNHVAKVERLVNQDHAQMYGNIQQLLKHYTFKTKWEEVLAKAYVNLYEVVMPRKDVERGQLRQELEMLRNFASSVQNRLEAAERTAKEQDNHHYYKIFAEGVKTLLDKL